MNIRGETGKIEDKQEKKQSGKRKTNRKRLNKYEGEHKTRYIFFLNEHTPEHKCTNVAEETVSNRIKKRTKQPTKQTLIIKIYTRQCL